jgi:hypothetical protein
MGGKGSGGTRVGAGRKTLDVGIALVRGSQDRGTRRQEEPTATPEAVQAPIGMPADVRMVWDEFAPLALANGSLTPSLVPGFAHLCKCIWAERILLAKIVAADWQVDKVTLQMDEKGGGLQQVEKKASDLIAKWQAMLVRVENGMARFRLTADGKIHAPTGKPKELSPLEKLQAQARQMKRG